MPHRERRPRTIILRDGETLPTPDHTFYLCRAVYQSPGVDDIEYVCLRNAGGTYSWTSTTVGAPVGATYITQTPNSTLTAEQALGSLTTGILKNTTTTGVLSIATAGTDYYNPGGTDVAVADGGTGSGTAAGARTNLGLDAGGAGDIWVEKAGDTMTGALVVNVASTNALKIQDSGTDVFLFETTNDRLHGHSGADVVLYSDAGITETIGIYGGNGELVFGGTSVTDVSIRSGSGSPEGALSAVIGSLFLRSDGGTDTAVYRKESGTGNTGWVAVNNNYTLADLTDVTAASPGSAAGKVLTWDGASAWDDNWLYTETLGPWYLNDVPGTATTSMALLYFNTATAVSKSTNRIRAGRTGWIVGMKITSDAARSGGTCTARIDLSGTGTAFDAGSVVLDATRTTQDATIIAANSGIQITSGGDTIGVQLVTSGWTPTTANMQVSVLVIWDPI